MKFFKISLMLLAMLLLVVLSACGGANSKSKNNSEASKDAVTSSPAASTPASEVPKADPVTISMYVWEGISDPAKGGNYVGVKDEFEKLNPDIKIEFKTLAGTDEDIMKKLDVSMIAGDNTDIIFLKNPTFTQKYTAAGFLLSMNETAQAQGYDLEKTYGKYLNKIKDNVYSLPVGFSGNILYYNKKIFDDAKVAYPSNDLTWDQYIELAKKLTDSKKGIYGSYMQPWNHYLYLTASQKKVPAYKEDGSSNLDDPAFKEALQFFNDLSAVHKVQPNRAEMMSKKLDWDAFTTGKFAMNVVGGWQMGILSDQTTYPRDWKFGVV
ncbi:MAG: extracellular solute-binding protein, partial [Gorillibacterium sp.]|nr:extracellular solute-binding protein [Gorillibacterium sp.]